MIRLPRAVLAVLVGLMVVFTSACGGSSATFPGGKTLAPGQTPVATVNPNDPSSIITSVIGGATGLVSGDQTVKSFHIKMVINGTIKAAALQSMLGSSASLVTSDLKLDGLALEGDVDVVNQAAHLTFNVPVVPFLALYLGSSPITGDLIIKDKVLYAKVSGQGALFAGLGDKYTKLELGDLTSSLPVDVPSAGPSTLSNVTTKVADLRKQMDDAGAHPTLVGVEKIGGKDAYHINIAVPLSLLNEQIAAAASPSPAPLTVDSATADLWAYKDTYYLAQLKATAASSTIGNLEVIVTVTNYDQPVSISAPPANQVQTPAP